MRVSVSFSTATLVQIGLSDGAAVTIKKSTGSIRQHSSINNLGNGLPTTTGINAPNSIYEIPVESKPEDLLAFCNVPTYNEKLYVF